MKKENVINLIRYHVDKNEKAFYNESMKIVKYFDQIGDSDLSEYILAYLSDTDYLIPQTIEFNSDFLQEIKISQTDDIKLPEVIFDDLKGIFNAIKHDVGINKFIFEGSPGTGKTEAAKHIAKMLNRKLITVNFSNLIDSKLGETNKNIIKLFEQITNIPHSHNFVILFDEIDAIALDRINNNDVREMGRVTSTILRELDKLQNTNNKAIIIATTNLYKNIDEALLRRFDSAINFNRYTNQDLIEIAEHFYITFIKKFKNLSKDIKLFKKILSLNENLPYPATLKNIIKTTIAFSDTQSDNDYFSKLYEKINTPINKTDIKVLYQQGFSVREIEKLTHKSKSSVARGLSDES